jgi:hypothetical protein
MRSLNPLLHLDRYARSGTPCNVQHGRTTLADILETDNLFFFDHLVAGTTRKVKVSLLS